MWKDECDLNLVNFCEMADFFNFIVLHEKIGNNVTVNVCNEVLINESI